MQAPDPEKAIDKMKKANSTKPVCKTLSFFPERDLRRNISRNA